MSKTEVLQSFKSAAKLQAEATCEGNSTKGNLNYEIIVKSASYLKKNNQLLMLEPLLGEEDIGIKLWASTYLLETIEHKALNVLNTIASANILHHSFTAEMILEEWKTGNLKLQFTK